MSETIPNDPAYPYVQEQYNSDGSSAWCSSMTGMTKRELFAMHMPPLDPESSANYAGIIVGLVPPATDATREEWSGFWCRANARYRVMNADALIAALNEDSRP